MTSRYMLFASRSAAIKGGMNDFVDHYPTLTLCIKKMLEMGIDPNLGGWWHIYDTQSQSMMSGQKLWQDAVSVGQKLLCEIDEEGNSE